MLRGGREGFVSNHRGSGLFWLKLATALWFLLVMSIYMYAAAATALGWWPLQSRPEPGVGVWFLCGAAGGLGATLYALRGFYWAVGPQRGDDSRFRYDPSWTWWYIFRPILGSVLGLVGYVAVRVALSPVRVPAPADEQSILPFVAIAFISGFGLTRVLAWLDRRVRAVFGEGDES